ncbi:MAG: PEGA domain-containing protein [Deltaproteobacteria bacterium]|nr:PEGA domain-containing protein [Deltaproteobacteria bacterium]
MSGLLLFGVASLTPVLVAAESATVLHAVPREPIGMIRLNPTGELGALRLADVRNELERILDAQTSLTLIELDAASLGDCGSRIVCTSAHLVSTLAGVKPRFLLQLSSITREGQADRMSARLVSTATATSIGRARGLGGAEEAEAEAYSRAVLATLDWTEVADQVALRELLEHLVFERLRPVFETQGAWRTLGRVEVSGVPRGCRILVDGALLGTTVEPGPVEVIDLPVGDHELRFEHPEHLPSVVRATVVWGTPVEIEARLRSRRTSGTELVRYGTMAAGGLVLVAGVSLTALAASAASGVATSGCIVAGGSRGERCDGWYSAGGVPLAPLGYSIALLGGTTAAGALVADETSGLVWSALAGLGAGTVSLLVSLAGAP